MGRPAKSVETSTGHILKEEKKERLEMEKKLKGNADKIRPFKHLNKRQKQIFKFILGNLNKDILSNLDLYVLNNTAICIDRLEAIEKNLNTEDYQITNLDLKLRDMYSKEFFRYCNELSLSPQARAKLSVSVVKPTKKTIMDILGDNDDEN